MCPENCAWFPDVGSGLSTIHYFKLNGDENREEWINGEFYVWRPQYITKMHYSNSASKWLACSGTSNCFYGQAPTNGNQQIDLPVIGELSDSDITKVALEMGVSCEGAQTLEVNLECNAWAHENVEVEMWYNLASVIVPPCTEFVNVRNIYVNVDPSDADPILRIEAKRASPTLLQMQGVGSTANAKQGVSIVLPLLKATYDACMELNTHHGQCLEELAGPDVPLRTNHTLQFECLVNNDTSITKCAEWRACLNGTDGLDVLVTVLEAASMVPSSLLQVTAQHALPHDGQELIRTSDCFCINDPDHRACLDPERIDLEAFDCKCWGDLVNKSATEIHEHTCGHSKVCCDWKSTHCATACTSVTPTLLDSSHSLLARRTSNHASVAIQNMDHLTNQRSLEETTLGKTCSD
jgi:hypothetical protein